MDTVSVAGDNDQFEDTLVLPRSPAKKTSRKRKNRTSSESDTDFQADSEDESESEQLFNDIDASKELASERRRSATNIANSSLYKQNGVGVSPISSSQVSQFPAVTFPMHSMQIKRGLGKSFVVPPRGSLKIALDQSEQRNGVEGITAQPTSTNQATHNALPSSANLASPKQLPITKATKVNRTTVKPFERAQIPIRNPLEPMYGSYNNRMCPACHKDHPQGACELKAAGVEHCGLCGLAHYGHSRTCPHIKSETQVREMLKALKSSPEKKELVDAAMKYLRGVKGTLVQQKKRDREKAAMTMGQPLPVPTYAGVGRPPKNATVQPLGAINGIGAGPHPEGFPNSPPHHDVPAAYYGPVNAHSENSGNAILGQRTFMQYQMAQQMHAQGHDDQHVESALRGYLGSG